MMKVKVTNKGKRTRDRLGSRFLPNKQKELEVSKREHLTLKAVKDFEVEIVEEPKEITVEYQANPDFDLEQYAEDEVEVDIDNDSDIDKDEDEATEVDDDELDTTEPEGIQNVQSTINNSNVIQVMDMVNNGEIDVDEAIAYETVGKNRATLIDQLEEKKQGD